MIRGIIENEIGFLAILEVYLEILKESRLVCFDGEEVVGLALSDEVLCDAALGQLGIGGDILVLDVDGIEEGDGHLDLVGLFEFLTIFEGKGAHFFWV